MHTHVNNESVDWEEGKGTWRCGAGGTHEAETTLVDLVDTLFRQVVSRVPRLDCDSCESRSAKGWYCVGVDWLYLNRHGGQLTNLRLNS